MLLGGERHVAAHGARPVNHSDVLVRVRDAVDVEESRGDQRARARLRGGRPLADEFHVQAALLFGLAQRGDLRVFIQLDVPAQRQPLAQLAMEDDQHPRVVDDEDGDGEVYLFVKVGHEEGD